MNRLDWLVLVLVITFIVVYGIWKTRRTTAEDFLAGGRKSPWWLVGISIMATQASAITFLSTPGQAYHDGLGFVQFYFGLPIAMVLLCIVVLPRFFKMKVYTAYEYLEERFGLPTRLATALLFLIQRGLSAGITIFAPAIILSTILGWNLTYTSLIIGSIVVIYTLIGGTDAVNQTQKQQMLIIFLGLLFAFGMIIKKLPVSLPRALELSGTLGKLEAVDFKFDLSNRYNIWSAFLGGTFLFLSYFGTDQSQVQRYLSGKSLSQARFGLLLNGLVKVPMQFFILLIGVLVFVFYQFNASPVHFNPNSKIAFQQNSQYQEFEKQHDELLNQRQQELQHWEQIKNTVLDPSEKVGLIQQSETNLKQIQDEDLKLRDEVRSFIKENSKEIEANDKDYVFIHFILTVFPHGLIGLLLAVILSAAMSSTSSELNALATTTVVDIYKRNFNQNLSEKQFLYASRLFTLFWGSLAILFAVKASLVDNLIQLVNIVGSLFYGAILGVFALAFLFPFVKGRAVFLSILIVEPLIIFLYFLNETGRINLEYLWLNPIGCLGMVAVANLLQHTILRSKNAV